jgi:hypothetical protein
MHVYAEPEYLEVWFLHQPVNTSYLKQNYPRVFQKLAQYERPRQCQRMGEYCFDPQIGLYEINKINQEIEHKKIPKEELEKDRTGLSPFGAVERDLINCQKQNRFDVFCGKAKKNKSKKMVNKLSVWIDTSSSMRNVDAQDLQGDCFRLSFMRRFEDKCPGVELYAFDTSIKQIDVSDLLCINHGLNNEDRLMKWIKESNSRNLIVVTDIFELTKKFVDYALSLNAHFKGAETLETFKSKDMLDQVDRLTAFCK